MNKRVEQPLWLSRKTMLNSYISFAENSKNHVKKETRKTRTKNW